VIYGFLLGLHILISFVLMLTILLQSGKGGGLAGAFGAAGGQAGQSLFGGRGAATFLSKATTVMGAAFMISSLLLAVLIAKPTSEQPLSRQLPAGSYAPDPGAPAPSLDLLNQPATDDAAQPGTVPAPATGDDAAPAAGDDAAPATGDDAAPADQGGDGAPTPNGNGGGN